MNIYDISKQAGVSIATVSRVLNGNPNVKPKTRKKVMDIIEKNDYTPNAFARGLGLDSMNSIGIMCADCSDLYLAKAVFYIEENLRKGGYNSILVCTGYEHESKKAALNLLMNQRVDAVILVGSNFIEADIAGNQYILDAAAHVPIMLLNADLDYPNIYCTMCDDFKATMEATLALIDSGISDILYLYNSKSFSGLKKRTGYESAFNIREIPVPRDLIHYFEGIPADVDNICHFLKTLHKKGLVFHAVLASDDILAMGAVKYAKHLGIRIPQELSVIGYNNSLLTACSDPELTSIDNHLETLCRQLVKTCIGTLNGEEIPQKTIFSGELVHRATTDLITGQSEMEMEMKIN